MDDASGDRVIKFNIKELIARKEYEERRTISLHEVAGEVGMGIATLSRIANSRGGYHTSTAQIEKLCRYFGCTPNDLITILPDDPETDPEGEEAPAPDS